MTTENSAVVKIKAQKDREISELKRQVVLFEVKCTSQRAEFVKVIKKALSYSDCIDTCRYLILEREKWKGLK